MVSTGNESMCSGFTDNFARFGKYDGIKKDSELDFFEQPEYMKKYMPSAKLCTTSKT